MKFLSIATFAWPDHYGGAERVIGEVARRLAARGHGVTLLTSRLGGQVEAERRDGVEWRRYPIDRRSPARFYRSVFAGVRRALADPACAGADVAHLHQIVSGLAALAPGGVRRLPVVCSFYAPYAEEFLAKHREGRPEGSVPARARAVSTLLARGDRWLVRRSDALLVLSRFSLEQVERLDAEAARRTTIAPAGVDLERFRPARDPAERRAAAALFGLPDENAPRLVTVRRLVPRMGLSDLVEAARGLATTGPAATFVIAGDGPERSALSAQVSSAGLAASVRLLGRVEENRLPELYRAADAFVLPTRALEGFGMATAEALASGLPVVATDVGATREILDGCPGATLVRPGDPAGLARALAARLADRKALARDGLAARAHAENRLSWDAHLDAVEEAAARAIASRRGGRGAAVRSAATPEGAAPPAREPR